MPRFLSGYRNSTAKPDEAAPRLGSAKDGSMPEHIGQLRAEPEERYFASRRRGSGMRLFVLLLLLAAVSFAYLHSQGRLEVHALRPLAQALGVESWLPSARPIAESPPTGGALSTAELTEVERLLDQLAFAPGAIDGVIDEHSAAAIRKFQDLAGTPADGAPSRKLLEELRVLVALQTRQPRR